MIEPSEPRTVASWTCAGLECEVKVIDLGINQHYCGYVKTNLTPSVPYDDERLRGVRVHGGLTYGPDEEGWVGFDCSHAGDVCRIDGGLHGYASIDKAKVWDVEDVQRETSKLAKQLRVLEDKQ